MLTTEEELESFTRFARQRLTGETQTPSLDELFDEWRILHPPTEDVEAIRASLQDMEQGETGRSFAEFAREFRSRHLV